MIDYFGTSDVYLKIGQVFKLLKGSIASLVILPEKPLAAYLPFHLFL
jgi:hypothetical protein